MLAIGIAANTAMFSVVAGILLDPLPFGRPEQLVSIGETRSGIPGDLVALPVYLSWERNANTVRVAAYIEGERTLAGSEPVYLKSAAVSASFFRVLDEPMFLGRGFSSLDDRFGAPRTIILRYALWQKRFSGDSAIVGRTIELEGDRFTVVGVTRPDFAFPIGAEVWMPLLPPIDPQFARVPSWKFLTVIGRLQSGASSRGAEGELGAMAAAIPQNGEWQARVTALRDAVVGDVRTPLQILMSAVVFVLLIAAANVGNLVLARNTSRARDTAIRVALGATGTQIMKEILAETLLIALMAGTLGTLGTALSLDAIRGVLPPELPRLASISMNGDVLVFTIAISLATGAAAGILPAMRSPLLTGVDVLNATSLGWRGVGRRRMRSWLLAGEIAISVVLLTAAGLLIRSFARIISVDPGFRAESVTAFEINPLRRRYPTFAAWHSLFLQLTAGVEKLPTVTSVALTSSLPLSGHSTTVGIVVEGGARESPNIHADAIAVSPGYFRTMRIPLIAGRDFQRNDETGTTPVAIVSERFAHTFFPGQSPLGKKVRPVVGGLLMREIVGVVADVHQASLSSSADAEIYLLAAHNGSGPLTLLVQSPAPIGTLVPAVRAVLRDIDPEQPIAAIATLREVLSRSVARQRFYAVVMAGFASIAIVLAVFGLSSVMIQLIDERRREVAVRVALGAQRHEVFRQILSQGLRPVCVGLAAGALGTALLVRLLAGLLFGIEPTDPSTLVGALGTVLTAATAAISYQAWRAATMNPAVELRR